MKRLAVYLNEQLSAEAKLGWPIVRERVAELCEKIAEALKDDGFSTTSPIAKDTTLKRAVRMLHLMDMRH